MGEIAADARVLLKGIERRLRRGRLFVVEGDDLMNIVANGLDPCPTAGRLAEEAPSRLRLAFRPKRELGAGPCVGYSIMDRFSAEDLPFCPG